MGGNDVFVLGSDLGLYDQYGFQAQVTQAATGAVVQGLLGGSFDFVTAGGEEVVSANAAGADLVMIGEAVDDLTTQLVTVPSITEPSQIKGKVGCTLSPSGSTFLSLRLYLQEQGLNPDTDATFISTGSAANNEAALRANRCQFTTIGLDAATQLEADGYHDLYDFSTTPYPTALLVTRRSTIQNNRAFVIRFLEATTATIQYVKTHPDETKADLVSRGLSNDANLQRTYEEGAAAYALPPTLDPPALQNMVQWNAEVSPAFQGIDISADADTSLMQELQTNGFLQSIGVQSQGS